MIFVVTCYNYFQHTVHVLVFSSLCLVKPMLQFLFSFQIVISHSVYSKGLRLSSAVWSRISPCATTVKILRRKGKAKLQVESFCCRSCWRGRGQTKHDVNCGCRSGTNWDWTEVGLKLGWWPGKVWSSADESGVAGFCHEKTETVKWTEVFQTPLCICG